MTIKYFRLLMVAIIGMTFASCENDDLDSRSIFTKDLENVQNMSAFDKWLDKNYRQPYNIEFNYRYIDNESDRFYNVVPCDIEKAQALAVLVKYVWLDSYAELMDSTFLKENAPRIIQLTGSFKYQANTSGETGGVVAGTAEGGLKIMFYGINLLDIDNAYINTHEPYSPARWNTDLLDLNYWFFHTMHHEFCHILTQKKDYSPEYRIISAADYHAADWVNLSDKKTVTEGFVSNYASMEYNEDFAEMYATYVTMDVNAWNTIMELAGEKGAPILNQKLKIVRDYFMNNWNLDIDKMRDIVVRRSMNSFFLNLRDFEHAADGLDTI